MANVIGLSEYQEGNLRTLAVGLLDISTIQARFDMGQYSSYGRLEGMTSTNCGTAGCAVGFAPFFGIKKVKTESWADFCKRVFGLDKSKAEFRWLFFGSWSEIDNTPEGASKRISWLLDKGLPPDFENQMVGKAPLCYNQKPEES